MANSRSSPPADEPIVAAARDALTHFAARIGAGDRPMHIAAALSGGRDSIALLDALSRIAPAIRVTLSAVHVHHGLSPNADAWAAFCAEQCAERAVPLSVLRVDVERGPGRSLEASARAARYDALASVDADAIVLAHHGDDQAETVLLQLLRGAGPRGLAAMPEVRPGAGPYLIRPWLGWPRAAIEDYARSRSLHSIDDESNMDRKLKRNFIRHEIAPRLAAAFPGYPQTLARAAAHHAEAALLLDELAAIDAAHVGRTNQDGALTLDRTALITLAQQSMPRVRNLVRWFLCQHDLPLPSTARLSAMLAQFVNAAPGNRVRLPHGGAELGLFRGCITVHAPAVPPFTAVWCGEPLLSLPHGTLEFTRRPGEGIALAALEEHRVTVRQRRGRERLWLSAHRGSQSVKRLLYDARIAPWRRAALPFVYCGETLAAVVGLGVDTRFRAKPGAPGFLLVWRPTMRDEKRITTA